MAWYPANLIISAVKPPSHPCTPAVTWEMVEAGSRWKILLSTPCSTSASPSSSVLHHSSCSAMLYIRPRDNTRFASAWCLLTQECIMSVTCTARAMLKWWQHPLRLYEETLHSCFVTMEHMLSPFSSHDGLCTWGHRTILTTTSTKDVCRLQDTLTWNRAAVTTRRVYLPQRSQLRGTICVNLSGSLVC